MQNDEAHALPDPLLDSLDDGVVHEAVGGMAPPQQHVRPGQPVDGQPVLGLVERRRLGGDVPAFLEGRRDRAMNSLGIKVANELVLLFVRFSFQTSARIGIEPLATSPLRGVLSRPAPRSSPVFVAAPHCVSRLSALPSLRKTWQASPGSPSATLVFAAIGESPTARTVIRRLSAVRT